MKNLKKSTKWLIAIVLFIVCVVIISFDPENEIISVLLMAIYIGVLAAFTW